MAANAVIGALRVNLGLNTAAFDKGAKRARGSSKSLRVSLTKAIAGVAAAFAAAAAVIGRSIGRILDQADDISKTAQSIGIATDELSRLAHAADLSGVGFDSLANGVGKLAKSMSDSLRSATSEQAIAFKALGISVTDAQGNLKSTSEVIDEVADKFEGMEDGAGKTAIAMSIFGRAGKDLIPLLNEGSDGIRKMKDEADALGIVIDKKTGKSAERFNDNLNRLGKVFQGVVTRIAVQLLPALETFAEFMLGAAKDSIVLKVAIEGLVFGFKVLISALIIGFKTLETIGIVIVGVGRAVAQSANKDFVGAADTISSAMRFAFENVQATADLVGSVWDDVGNSITRNADPTSDKVAAPLLQATDKIKKATKTVSDTARGAASSMANAFSDAFQELALTGNRVLDGLLGKLVQIGASDVFTSGGLANLAGRGGSAGGAGLSGFGGFFAAGGIPPAGRLSIVGEDGPEFLVGDGRAAVVPGAGIGGGTVVNVMPNLPGVDLDVQTRRTQTAGGEQVDVLLRDRNFQRGIRRIAQGPGKRTL